MFPALWSDIMTRTPEELRSTAIVGTTSLLSAHPRHVSLLEALTWPANDLMVALAATRRSAHGVAHFSGLYEKYAPPERAILVIFLICEMESSFYSVSVGGENVVCRVSFPAQTPWPAALLLESVLGDLNDDGGQGKCQDQLYIGEFRRQGSTPPQSVTAEQAIAEGFAALLPATLTKWAHEHAVGDVVAELLADADMTSVADLHKLASVMHRLACNTTPCMGCNLRFPGWEREFWLCAHALTTEDY